MVFHVMDKLPAFMFYPKDWLGDDIAGCSLAAQGLWLRMMLVMHFSKRYGYLELDGVPMSPESIAFRCGARSLDEYTTLLSELDRAGVPSKTNNGTIYSRRMVRDARKRLIAKQNGKKGGNPKLKALDNQPHNPSLNMQLNMNIPEAKKEKAQRTREGTAPRKKAEGSHPELLAFYCQMWRGRYKTDYKIIGGRDGNSIKQILEAACGDLEKAKKVVKRFVDDSLPWLVENSHPLTVLVVRFNHFNRPAGINGSYLPPLTEPRHDDGK